MQRRQDEWTAAISTRALKESDGPSNFHLKSKHPIINRTYPWKRQAATPGHIEVYLKERLYASAFSARYFMVFATDSASFNSPICRIEPGAGAKSWMFGAPTTTGIEPTGFDIKLRYLHY